MKPRRTSTHPYFSEPDTLLDAEEISGVRERDGRIGTLVGGAYTLLRCIGKGSGGSVFEARHEPSRTHVAVKVLHSRHATSKLLRKRFERESRTAAVVRHEHIVRLFDAGIDSDGTPWQAMELLVGRDLATALDERPLSIFEAASVGVQLLSALEAVHVRGFVHRDVKPENVFLTWRPDGALWVKLLDFGIVKPLQDSESMPAVTEDNVLLGTPQYMAPEQITGDLPVTPATDIWAVGAVLFTALAGRAPFADERLSRLLTKIAREAAPSVALYRPDVPVPIAQIVAQALRNHPSHRYRSARDMASALAAAFSHVAPAR